MVVFVLFPLMILNRPLTIVARLSTAPLPQASSQLFGRAPDRAADPFSPPHRASRSSSSYMFVMVLVSGVWNNLRSMVTGWYDLGDPEDDRCPVIVLHRPRAC